MSCNNRLNYFLKFDYKILFTFFFLAIFLAGCSTKEPVPNSAEPKVFESEDALILSALDFYGQQKYKESAEIFDKLYEKNQKIDYLKEIVKIYMMMGELEKANVIIAKGLEKYPQDTYFKRLEIAILTDKKDFEKAKKQLEKLLLVEKNQKNYELAASVYFALKDYNLALKYYESAYKYEYDEDVLLKISSLLYEYLDRKEDAVASLESHARIKGCGNGTCLRLAQIYGHQKDIDALINIFKRLYDETLNQDYAQRVIELYVFKGDKEAAVDFLEKSRFDDRILMDFYMNMKKYKKALEVAKNIYQKESNIDMYARIAILEYESAQNKNDQKLLKSVIKKFESVNSTLKDPVFLNYHGYILIDHDLDIKKGIELVREALKSEPDSPFYLDSLSWGLYKLGRCKEALELQEKAVQKLPEKEILEHYEIIKKCIQDGTKHNEVQ